MRTLALAAALSLLPAAARADEPYALRGDSDLTKTYVITGSALAFTGVSELLKDQLAPVHCRWCNPGSIDSSARNALLLSNVDQASRASDLVALGMIPAAAAWQALAARGAGGGWAEGGRDVLYIAEAVSIATAATQVTKYAVGRQRPFVHYGDPNRPHAADDNLSFFSGHTSFAFSLAAATGTVTQLRGYDGAPWVWGVGMTLAASVGYFRIAADKHYLSDVLVGAAVGTAAGIAVPRLLHPREPSSPGGASTTVTVVPLGLAGTF